MQAACTLGEKNGHTACVDREGQAWLWGASYKGKLGVESWSHSSQQIYSSPQALQVPEGEKVVKVLAGGIHSAALTNSGRLYTWGCGSNGRLGHPDFKGHVYLYKESYPKLLQVLANVSDAASSYYAMAAISNV